MIQHENNKVHTSFGFTGNWLLYVWLLIFLTCVVNVFSQEKNEIPVRQIRGTVTDQVLGTPVDGATVLLTSLNRMVTTDKNGNFRFADVPVGTQQLVVSFTGYREVVLDNVVINSGKETVLTIRMENYVRQEETVMIKVQSRRNKPLNEMSTVSARAFTVEETQRYAAAVNDPSRMAMGFPGVQSADDGNNTIIIRGNSPTGLLWRMEGVDIPNPNHFSSTGSSGGGISILSTQLLSNSDFITGAFASEYGNALAGVFDLKLRKGNNEKNEYALQAGLLGLNAAAEGPFIQSLGGSYLVNYRYSTLELLSKVGFPFEGGTTNFQDLSFNVFLPTERSGTFTWFGFGGLSSQQQKAIIDSTKWDSNGDRYSSRYLSNTGASGMTHYILLAPKTSLRSALALSYSRISEQYSYVQDDYSLRNDYRDNYKTRKLTTSSTMDHKFSVKSSLRAGAIVNLIAFDYYKRAREHENDPLKELINTKNNTQTLQGFAQWQYKPVNWLTLNAGLHYLQLFYNNTRTIEPRGSLKCQVTSTNSIAFGFGQHSQIQAPGVYFAEIKDASGNLSYPNRKLGLSKARHYVISLQHSFGKNLALKTELYYQQLYKIPVSNLDSSSFSMLNVESEYVTDALVNHGKGRNYGIEISLEKYLFNAFYYTLSTSLYQSKYTASDGIERDTRFNGKYIANLVAGKDFISSNKLKTFGINVKAIYAGGLRNTPIDEQASHLAGYAIYRNELAFSVQNPDYFRTDLRLSMKWNRKKLTSTLSLDVQNVTNRINVYGQWYDSRSSQIITSYQNGLIPVLNYKVEF